MNLPFGDDVYYLDVYIRDDSIGMVNVFHFGLPQLKSKQSLENA